MVGFSMVLAMISSILAYLTKFLNIEEENVLNTNCGSTVLSLNNLLVREKNMLYYGEHRLLFWLTITLIKQEVTGSNPVTIDGSLKFA